MRIPKLTKRIAFLVLLGGCAVGPRIEKLEEPRHPFGANVALEVTQPGTSGRQKYEGELIEVREDGLVFALRALASRPSRVTFVPWMNVYSVTATELPGRTSKRNKSKGHKQESIDKMRIVSRYPQGLSADLMQRLLVSFDQETIDTLAENQGGA